MASSRCYNNSDVIATLITTNFHLYLIQLWWQFFQMFVYGDVVYAQTWQLLTLKNNTVWSHFHMPVRPMLLPSFLFDCFVKIWATCKNFWANGLPPPPRQKIARTPMIGRNYDKSPLPGKFTNV